MTNGDPAYVPGCVLGIDVGSVRVGVAGSDATRTLATPLATLPRQSRNDELWTRLAREISDRDARVVVVGLPRMLDGSEGEAAQDARRFAAEVERRTGMAVELWDERLTTVQAERTLVDAGIRRSRRRARVDAVAAALLLQNWLDARRVRTGGATSPAS